GEGWLPLPACRPEHPKRLHRSSVLLCSYRTSHQFVEPASRDLDIAPLGCLRLLLKRMQHINGTFHPRRVDDPICAGLIPDPNLLDTFSNGGHRLEVIGS